MEISNDDLAECRRIIYEGLEGGQHEAILFGYAREGRFNMLIAGDLDKLEVMARSIQDKVRAARRKGCVHV